MQKMTAGIVEWLKSEPKRIARAFGCALEGLRATFLLQAAFRLEVIAAFILIPWVMSHHRMWPAKKSYLIGVVVLVLIVELLNTGIEAAIDRISPENHQLSKLAKDVGAAAVLVALLYAAFVWCMLL